MLNLNGKVVDIFTYTILTFGLLTTCWTKVSARKPLTIFTQILPRPRMFASVVFLSFCKF